MPAFMLQRGEATHPQFRWQDVALEHCPALRMNRLAIALLVAMLATSAYAGSWGSGSFENDDALDWANQCVNGSGAQPLIAVFDRVKSSQVVEAPDGASAIAASEVIAAALGKPGQGLPSELRAWLARQPKSEIVAQAAAAKRALKKVEDARTSELQQLWAEDKTSQWLSNVKALEARLGSD